MFDMDGTLFDTSSAVVPAIQDAALKVYNQKFNEKFIISLFGKPMTEFYNDLAAVFDTDKKDELLLESKKNISEYIPLYGKIYPGVYDTIQALSGRKKLFICSNGPLGYIEAILKKFELSDYFIDIGYHTKINDTKIKVMNDLINKHDINSDFVMIGDRIHDFEAANYFSGDFIGADFGYGNDEISMAKVKIKSFSELKNIFL